MSDDAKVNMLLYCNLLPDEQQRLEPLDDPVAQALIKAGETDRAIWTSRTEVGLRAICLQVGRRIAMQITPAELAAMSDGMLLAKIRDMLAVE